MANITDASETVSTTDKKSAKWVLMAGVLAIVGSAAGFAGVYFGIVPIGSLLNGPSEPRKVASPKPDVAFVPIPPLIVTLPPEAANRHLRFSGTIEVPAEYEEDVAFLMPRIQDLMNGYLRALTAADIEGPGSIFRIRLHLLKRILMVVGEGKVNGLLITEFILR